jgi:transposase
MRIIGLDLGVTSEHKAVVMEEKGEYVGGVFVVRSWPTELAGLVERGRAGVAAETPLVVVMEPTGLAWLPVAAYLCRQAGVKVYLVNAQQVADLRRFYHKHAKSDRIDARVLAKLYLVGGEKLHPLRLPSADTLALKRACQQLDWCIRQIIVLKNQIMALDQALWLNGWQALVFSDNFSPAARWCRQHYYDPYQVVQVGATQIQQEWQQGEQDSSDGGAWASDLLELAEKVVAVYGPGSPYADFAAWQAEVSQKQKWLAQFEADAHRLRRQEVRPRYRRLHPSRHLETLKGVGQDSAAVFLSFIAAPSRFADPAAFRAWSGLVPRSAQSANRESKGLHISQAGPDLVKKYAFLDADVARRYDPQLAKVYYDQMVHHGKHHTQAVCAVATHLLDRVLVVLQQDRPYELRDVDGTPLSAEQARQLIADHYTVPPDVRRRNNRHARQQRVERRAERQLLRQTQREGRPVR